MIIHYNFNNEADRLNGLKTLDSVSDKGLTLISLYFKSFGPKILQKIKSELSELKNIKSKETQKIIELVLKKIQIAIKEIPFNFCGVLFASHSQVYVVQLPSEVGFDAYICSKKFHLDPLRNYIQVQCGLIVLDTSEYAVGTMRNNRIVVLDQGDLYISRKIKAGGQSSQRFEETRRKEVDAMIKNMSEKLDLLFENKNLKKIFLGGIQPTVTLFYKKNCCKPEVKKLLAQPVSTCYTNAIGLQELVEKCSEAYTELLEKYLLEKKQYNQMLSEIVDGKAAPLRQLAGLPLKINYVHSVSGILTHSFYCETCKIIYVNNKCIHTSIPLEQYPGFKFLPGIYGDMVARHVAIVNYSLI